MWVLWNKLTYVSLPRWRGVKRTCIWVLRSSLVVYCMRTEVCSCICMLYVILVNACRVGQLIFTVQCELSKLQINPAKIFHFFCKKQQKLICFTVNRRFLPFFRRFCVGFSLVNWLEFKLSLVKLTGFTGFYRFIAGKPLPVGGDFYMWNGFVNHGYSRRDSSIFGML
jgi:hypothetical protein